MQGTEGVSLFFQVGTRPTAADVERALSHSMEAGRSAQVSYRPPGEQDHIELISGGLTYDVSGLAPGEAAPVPPVGHVFSLPPDIADYGFEPILLAPGSHIAAGGGLLPIAKMLVGLAADLALDLPITAVCWNPARCWMEPRYFGRVALNWLAGGPFPALGLTGLNWRRDGALESAGLSYFVGQEVRVPRHPAEQESDTVRFAGRIIDHLIRNGPIERAESFAGPGGEVLTAAFAGDGRHVVVTRAG